MDIPIPVLCVCKAVVSVLCALTALLDLVCCTACFSVFASYSTTVDVRNCVLIVILLLGCVEE